MRFQPIAGRFGRLLLEWVHWIRRRNEQKMFFKGKFKLGWVRRERLLSDTSTMVDYDEVISKIGELRKLVIPDPRMLLSGTLSGTQHFKILWVPDNVPDRSIRGSGMTTLLRLQLNFEIGS